MPELQISPPVSAAPPLPTVPLVAASQATSPETVAPASSPAATVMVASPVPPSAAASPQPILVIPPAAPAPVAPARHEARVTPLARPIVPSEVPQDKPLPDSGSQPEDGEQLLDPLTISPPPTTLLPQSNVPTAHPKMYSYNSSQVLHARARNRLVDGLLIALIVVTVAIVYYIWQSIGSPTDVQSLPFLKSLL